MSSIHNNAYRLKRLRLLEAATEHEQVSIMIATWQRK
jgi:hypothetical protein